jgi:uncharacterized protein YndB with AHSA1/START domain
MQDGVSQLPAAFGKVVCYMEGLRTREEGEMSAKPEPIRRSIMVPCSVEQAFRVFTQEMSSWWPLGSHSRAVDEELPGVSAVGVEVEPRPGGQVLERLSNGERLPWGRILVWDPPARVVIVWKPNGHPLPPTELELNFRAEGAETRVLLEHRGWERLGGKAEKARAGYVEGWLKVFDGHFGRAARMKNR